MIQQYLRFIRKVSVNGMGRAGVALTTSSFVTFLILELARVAGILTNAYIGLITYLLLPTMFIVGLVLIPLAWQQQKKTSGKTTKELLDSHFDKDDTSGGFFGSRIVQNLIILTLLNVLFLILASSQMLSFMDKPEFCGTACHSVMHPEWISYQQSPHAHVKCVECHVGEGVDALLASKLNGAYQMLSISLNLYEKPIPTPVHQLRPARETCEKCHWPDKFYGSRMKSYTRYKKDEANTVSYTTLNLKIDAGGKSDNKGIHWHISKDQQVRYASVDDKRLKMLWVETVDKDGQVTRFRNSALRQDQLEESASTRVMDCVDCHNRATHIYEDPAQAVDLRMQQGKINPALPFIKRQGLAAIRNTLKSKEAGLRAIRNQIEGFYRQKYPKILATRADDVEQAIQTLQAIYNRNIHPRMNVFWGSYPNFIGHKAEGGCFRCHNRNMVSEEGQQIPYDCTTCHSILAQEEPHPFMYLQEPDSTKPNYRMHQYLKDEFLQSLTP